MQQSKTLTHFFQENNPATLENCDSEQIHLSGRIQNIGAILVIDQTNHMVIGASENVGALFGSDTQALLSSTLASADQVLADQVALLDGSAQVLHEILDYALEYNGTHYDAVTHVHAGRRLIEFLPNLSPSPTDLRSRVRRCSHACSLVMSAESFDAAVQIAVKAACDLTGFARTKIYKFLPDWSGVVLAEHLTGGLPSFLGLHFPDTDIPKQVRALMTIVPYRAIGTMSDDSSLILTADGIHGELDLTWSLLRSVSTMHTAYMRNIGAQASYSGALIYRDKLWGLLAIHGETPELIPFDSWSLLQEIGTTLMLRLDQQERVDTANMITNLRHIENKFASLIRQNDEIEPALVQLVSVLQNVFSADGFAFQYGSDMHVSGQTPPTEFIRELITWSARMYDISDQLQTSALHRLWAPALAHKDTACGVLIQPIATHRVCQLVWFRGPITKKVTWAGRPDGKSEIDPKNPLSALGPRQSFDAWVEEHRDESEHWQPEQLASAREIFTQFLDIITSQLLLKNQNESLKLFAAAAVHDIRAPLQGIRQSLEFMGEVDLNSQDFKELHAIASRSANRLNDLTSGLLELAVFDEQGSEFTPISLNKILSDVCDTLASEITESDAKVVVDKLPTLNASEHMIFRLFLNLVANSLKFKHPDRNPEVHVSAAQRESGCWEISVSDNGQAIAPEYATEVFEPMKRLHRRDNVEGSGLGLTTCKRVMEIHSGSIHLDTNFETGARFVMSFKDERSP